MFYRQFTVVAIATLLISPNFVQAREVYGEEDLNLSVGNVQILNTPDGSIIQTPKIQVSTPLPSSRAVVTRTRRTRTSIRRTRTATPLIFNKKVNSTTSKTVTTTTNSGGNTSIVQSSTVRSSSDGSTKSTQSASTDRQQSIECNGNGTTVSRSTSTVNDRTVSSQQTSCN
ncbi:hypothetical protein [Chamaesiphon sp. OTE_20_metabat_361]|uniref:hypothetical protein n=1 Tax=Chamaesiphon sp. OTE_20_metabat_361 TaxID=2964689 RepID=UPI00286C0207|nr:hypothetical protein [Chamaesiphon sp. OTE_20_metabat_361]